MRNCKITLALVVMILSMFTINSYASSQKYEVDVVNTLSIGDIQIELSEYDMDGNLLTAAVNQVVLPNQTVEKITRITNKANTAWLRAKVEYISSSRVVSFKDNTVNITDSNWQKIGEYYYYTKPVQRNHYVDLFGGYTIPSELDSSSSGSTVNIIITAEAVQEKNFTPDFNTDDPWFGTVIETSVNSKYDKTRVVNNQSFQVVFEDGTSGLVKVGNDFFSNFDELMPGDVVKDTVTIANNYNKTVEIYFRTDHMDNNAISNFIKLEIDVDGKSVYSGSLNAQELNNGISLGSYSRKSSKSLIYTLTVPSDAGNSYAQTDTAVKWVFYTTLKTPTGGDGDTGGGGSSGGGSGTVAATEAADESIASADESITSEDLIKIPDDLLDLIKDLDDDRLKYYLDKEYLTESEWNELIELLDKLGVPVTEWMNSMPKTGDDFNHAIYLFGLTLSLSLLLLLISKRHYFIK